MHRSTRTFVPAGLLSLLVAALALSGCGGHVPFISSASEAHGDNSIAVTREQDGRFIAFVGPKTQHDPPFLGVGGTNIDCLRSWLDTRTGEIANQLYVEDSYAGPERGWNAAQDAAGQSLRFIAIGKDEITCEGGCSYAEEFAASVPEAVMRANTGDLSVTFVAKSGERMLIRIPGEQVANQLAAIDSARKGLAPAPAPPAAAAPELAPGAMVPAPPEASQPLQAN
jgi:hypothetical protein